MAFHGTRYARATSDVTPSVASTSAALRPAFASAAAPVTATGTLRINGGATVQLTGTYETTTYVLTLSGGGYTFTGTATDDGLEGTFNSAGQDAGSFSGSVCE